MNSSSGRHSPDVWLVSQAYGEASSRSRSHSQPLSDSGSALGIVYLSGIFMDGDMPLAVPFLDLYSCAWDLQAIISTTWISLLTKSFLGPIFRRNLTESAERHLLCLLEDLYKIFIPEGGQDLKVWVCSRDCFSLYLPSMLLSFTILCCPLCLSPEESLDHLLLNCKVSF